MSDTPLQAPSPEYLGELLPQYGIESLIAQGGMGAVYKASQLSLDRHVAIKVLLYEFGGDAEFRESFTTEAKAMARLNHPNLIGVFDYGTVEGMPYIVMEYVNGQSLHEAAWNQAIQPSQAVAIVKGICDGLAHAHRHDIVHRDIKPSNILLTPEAMPKIADFGLARATDSDKSGLVMGTPGYTAPEVFQDPNQAGPLADLYSVGVILHQLLTGIDPAGSMGPPTQATGNLRLDAIWRKATHIDAAQRYPSVAALAADLGKGFDIKSAGPVANRRVPSAQSARPIRVETVSGGGGAMKLVVISVLAVGGFLAYRIMQDHKKLAGEVGTEANGTEQVAPPAPVPYPGPPVRIEPAPPPEPVPGDVAKQDEPVPPPVVEPKPEEKPAADLPPGDPELRTRAIGLIADSRKKRDKELAENVRSLRSDLAGRARAAKTDEASLIGRIEQEIADDRVPIIVGAQGVGDRLAASIKLAHTKEDSIDAGHRSDLTRIRDAYVTRLKARAAAETADPTLKPRLLAQADQAADLDAWVQSLVPEPKWVPRRVSAGGFAGKWTSNDNRTNHWLAHPDGRLEVVGTTWDVHWVMLDDGSLEVRFADKKKPYKFTRDGDGWTGKTSFGQPASLTRGDW